MISSGGIPPGLDSPRVLFAQDIQATTDKLVELIIKHPGYAKKQKIHRKLLDLLDDLENHDAMN